MNVLSLFCKTYRGDLERFKILKESVDKFNKDKLAFYVVCPKVDFEIFDNLKNGKETYEYRVITDEEVLGLKNGEANEQSWYSQQVIKLTFWKLGLCKHYLSLDSDCYFISDFCKEDYLFNDDIPYLPLTEPLKGAECNFMQIFRFFEKNKDEEKLYNTVSKNYISRGGKRMCLNVPCVLSYDALKHMEDNFLKQKKLKVSDLIEINPYEYEWYCDYVLKFKPIDYFVSTPFFVSFYNEAFYQLYRKLGFTEEILATYYTGIIMHEGWIKDKKFRKSFIGSIVRKLLIISYLRHEQKYPKKLSFGKKLKRFWRNYYTIPFRVFRNKKKIDRKIKMKKAKGLKKRWYMLRDLVGFSSKKYNYKNNYTYNNDNNGLCRFLKYIKPMVVSGGKEEILSKKNLFIHQSVNIHGTENSIVLGDNVFISENCCFQASAPESIFIGNNVYIALNNIIWSANHNYEDAEAIPFDKKIVVKPVVIEDNVWVCGFCRIVPGVRIGEGAVIAMGSVVCHDVPPLAIVGGNPAKVIKYRDKDKYEKLKEEKKLYCNVEEELEEKIIIKSKPE